MQSDGFLKDNSNAAQRLLDGVNLVAQSVSELSVKPAKAVTSWLTDQIAPAYWKPNSLISVSDTRRPAPQPARHPPPIRQINASLPTDVFTGSLRAALTQSCVCGSQDKTRHGSWLAGQFCLVMSVVVLSLCVQGVPQMSHSLPGQRHQTSLPCLRGGLLRWLLFPISARPRERLGSRPRQGV